MGMFDSFIPKANIKCTCGENLTDFQTKVLTGDLLHIHEGDKMPELNNGMYISSAKIPCYEYCHKCGAFWLAYAHIEGGIFTGIDIVKEAREVPKIEKNWGHAYSRGSYPEIINLNRKLWGDLGVYNPAFRGKDAIYLGNFRDVNEAMSFMTGWGLAKGFKKFSDYSMHNRKGHTLEVVDAGESFLVKLTTDDPWDALTVVCPECGAVTRAFSSTGKYPESTYKCKNGHQFKVTYQKEV